MYERVKTYINNNIGGNKKKVMFVTGVGYYYDFSYLGCRHTSITYIIIINADIFSYLRGGTLLR